MSRDYANKNMFSNQRKTRKRSGRNTVWLAAIACFCLLGALVVYGVHLHETTGLFSKEKMSAWVDSAKSILGHKIKQPINKSAKSPDSAQNDDIHFDFYTELPNMRVNLPASADSKVFTSTKPAAEKVFATHSSVEAAKIDDPIKTSLVKHPATIQAAKQYILQIGEFGDLLSASQMRLSLLLAGFDTQVVQTPTHRYRVQQGPYTSEREAKSAQRQMNKSGFDSIIKNSI